MKELDLLTLLRGLEWAGGGHLVIQCPQCAADAPQDGGDGSHHDPCELSAAIAVLSAKPSRTITPEWVKSHLQTLLSAESLHTARCECRNGQYETPVADGRCIHLHGRLRRVADRIVKMAQDFTEGHL